MRRHQQQLERDFGGCHNLGKGMLSRARSGRNLEHFAVEEWATSTSRRRHDKHADNLKLGQHAGNMTLGPAPFFCVFDAGIVGDWKLFGTKNVVKHVPSVLQ